MNSSATEDPQAFIFSPMGSWPAGIGLGLIVCRIKMVGQEQTKIAQTGTKESKDLATGQGRRNSDYSSCIWTFRRQTF